ncbi:hypothetical protein [Desulfosporosinus sp.]|uniref:hypothetical protein n=1 Tax=Desulfosporosinus sp. TaxID=157907 RepID=UPI0023283595|nr:hypothetical protein [Desulfosporosinus sp.]MCO5386201.1 hypothetical protein [Desulfosporosinus sp.]MDA8222395.1 hypothetical protein [Desulfitobacterium hafniense]
MAAFLKRTKLPEQDFAEVLGIMQEFLGGIWNAIADEKEFFGVWDCSTAKWV